MTNKRDRHHHHHHHHHHHGEDRRRAHNYAYTAGEPGPGPNQYKLRRDTERGKVAGVCAGFANYFGWDLKLMRLGMILSTIFFFPMPIFAYGAAAFFIPRERAPAVFETHEEERFWRTFSTRPTVTFSNLRHRFRALEARIGMLEAEVTSNEFGLRRAFDDLEKGK